MKYIVKITAILEAESQEEAREVIEEDLLENATITSLEPYDNPEG